MLLANSAMDDETLRDELLTLLVAGHETTANALAWALERLARHPGAWERLRSGDEAYLDAVVKETLRLRPVIPIVLRLLKAPMEIAGYELPAGVAVAPSILLLHTRADVYPEPFAFRPERFLEKPAGTYTWIPFGGGVRRCLGASFALFEMKAVLRAIAANVTLTRAGPPGAGAPDPPRGHARAPPRRADRHGGLGAIRSAWAPRATGPSGSLSTDVARPAPPSRDLRLRRHAHPLAARRAQRVHRQLGVDEVEAVPREQGGDAVAGVGHGEHALQRRRLDALQDRRQQPRPHRGRPGRRSSRRWTSATRPSSRSRTRRTRAAGASRSAAGAAAAGRPRWPPARRARASRAPATPGARPRAALRPAARPSGRAARPTPRPPRSPTGIAPRISNVSRAQAISGLLRHLLHLPRQQRTGRPRVLVARIPRPARARRGLEAPVAQRDVEAVQAGTIAAVGRLGRVHAAVGHGEQVGHGLAVGGEHGHADRRAHATATVGRRPRSARPAPRARARPCRARRPSRRRPGRSARPRTRRRPGAPPGRARARSAAAAARPRAAPRRPPRGRGRR